MMHRKLVVLLAASFGLLGCPETPEENNGENNNNMMMVDPAEQRTQWDQCVAQTTEYMQFQETISTVGRVGGFERIAD